MSRTNFFFFPVFFFSLSLPPSLSFCTCHQPFSGLFPQLPLDFLSVLHTVYLKVFLKYCLKHLRNFMILNPFLKVFLEIRPILEFYSWRLHDFIRVNDWVKVTQSRPTLCDPMDYTVHGSQNTQVGSHALLPGSSQPRVWTQVSHVAGGFFTSWATREAPLWRPRYDFYFANRTQKHRMSGRND